ncbi:MAG: C10 family peptidase [Kiritimatiellae bacterium]|nr:C10 family peptidase [Kiritimatiellia bacterium]
MKFHKKFHVVAMLAAILALNAQAAEVSSVQVKRAVSAWAAANGSAFANPGSVTGATPVKDSDGTVLYWIVKMSNGGVVIASPDTDLDLVIAVLEKSDGTFPAGHPLPSILKKDMKNRLSIIRGSSTSSATSGNSGVRMASALSATTQSTAAELPEDVKASVTKANAQWAKYDNPNAGVNLLGASLEGGDASPYVRRIVDGFETGGRFTHWNQSESPIDGNPLYNLYTPNNAVCGCVATAGSAIMQFFGCTNDIGVVKGEGCSYNGSSFECSTREGVLDWSSLPTNDVGDVNNFIATNDVARDLIGRVAYNMGVLVGMGWTDDESGAVTLKLADAFMRYGFKSAAAVSYEDGLAGAAPYYKMIYAQNWAGSPVAMSIRGDIGGHAVVACGYARDGDGDEFCRVFMGWGGSGDSWYKFPNVGSFNTINGAVSMLGYRQEVEVEGFDSTVGIDSDAVVPVCGTANVKNTTLVIPDGTYKVEVDAESMEAKVVPADLVVPVDGKGFFATRIPLSMKGPRLVHPDTGSSMAIEPFDSKVLSSSNKSRVDYEKAMPSELLFLVMNMKVASTVASAREIASREGKALLMASGSGSERDQMLIDYISYLDSTSDMSNRFVFVHVNSADATSTEKDGDPSIGVFDPDDGAAELRWWEANGRLTYDNFIDINAENSEALNYTFCATNAVALTNSVDAVLAAGYDSYQRIHSEISVTVASLYADSFGEELIGSVFPAYGIHEKCWTNGECVVFSALEAHTNFTSGVAYSCIGWEMYDAEGVVTNGLGNRAEITLENGMEVVFVWLWEPSHYRVEASHIGLPVYGMPEDLVVVTPETAWVEAGARVTLKAETELGDYRLKEWILSRVGGTDYTAFYNDSVAVRQNGGTVSFFVYEPVSVAANYSTDSSVGSIAGEAKEYKFEINSVPEEFKDFISLKHGCVWGTNTTIDPVIQLEPAVQSYKDSTNVVWVCTGWEINGTQYEGADAAFELYSSELVYSVKCLWGVKPPDPLPDDGDDDGEEDPGQEDPVPAPIAFSSISQALDGTWTLVLTNAVKDCWYHLEYTDSLLPVDWKPAMDPVQATENGPIVFSPEGNGAGRFWRARATTKETGN